MPKYDSDYFKEKFPNLYKEIKEGTKTIEVDGVRTEQGEGEKDSEKKEGEGPNIIDFIRLCDEEDEALEIINFMEEEGKIDSEYAIDLRNQLTRRGLRSFGSKRKPGEYPSDKEDDE